MQDEQNRVSDHNSLAGEPDFPDRPAAPARNAVADHQFSSSDHADRSDSGENSNYSGGSDHQPAGGEYSSTSDQLLPGEHPSGRQHMDADDVSDAVNDDVGRNADDQQPDQEWQLLGALEAVLLVAAEPVPLATLSAAIGASQSRTEELLRSLAHEYSGDTGGRPHGFQLREIGGGWRLYTNPAYADIVAAHVTARESGRLSAPALETLAVIAYRQPVTRGQIAAIRGVSVDSVVRTLQTRGLIDEVGTQGSTGALLYGTTAYFLEVMGLNSLAELPPLAPYLPEASELDDVAKDIP